MLIGMDKITIDNSHPCNAHGASVSDRMNVRMRWSDAVGKQLKSGRNIRQITNAAVRDHA
jgi:hypothetical protein